MLVVTASNLWDISSSDCTLFSIVDNFSVLCTSTGPLAAKETVESENVF